MKKVFLAVLLLAAAIFWLGRAEAGGDQVLAKVGDKKITVADFERFISSYPPEKQKFLRESLQNREILLKRLTQVIALSDLARKKGLDKDERIREQIGYYTDEILAQELLRRELSNVAVTDEDMESYYKANMDTFKQPEMVRARHILIKVDKSASEEEKAKAKEKAEGILKRIKAGEDFAKLAKEYSDDPGSKANGGELGFFARGRMVEPFEEAAFALKPGEVSGVIQTDFGFHIIKVEEKKAAGVEPFEEAKEKVRSQLMETLSKQRAKTVLEDALRETGAEMHPELLEGAKKAQ